MQEYRSICARQFWKFVIPFDSLRKTNTAMLYEIELGENHEN